MSSSKKETRRRKLRGRQEAGQSQRRSEADPEAGPSASAASRAHSREYHSDSDPEANSEESVKAFLQRFNSATERERNAAEDLVNSMKLIIEQSRHRPSLMMQQILDKLRPLIPGMPKYPQTVLVPRDLWDIESTEIQGGLYWHRGLEAGIRAFRASDAKELTFDVDIEEVPLDQLTNSEFRTWVIQARLHEATNPPGEPFVVGVFCGDSRPLCEEFLGPFIEEAARLCELSMTVNGDSLTVKPRLVIADVAARAFLKGTVHQSNYYGCTQCTIKGKLVSDSTITFFGETNTRPRTNEEFRGGVYAGTHQQMADGQPVVTPLVRLPIDIVQDVTIGDDRCLLHIGAAKTLFFAFNDGIGNIQAMDTLKHDFLEHTLCAIRLPHERRPRQFETNIAQWPPFMWGCFMDIVGIVILKPTIRQQYYDHYCKLHWAIAICNHGRYRHLLNYARQLIIDFVTEHHNLVGYVTSTFHHLLHIVDEVEKFGPLPLQSSYPFKAALRNLKAEVDITRKTPPIKQIAHTLLLREGAFRHQNLLRPLPPSLPIPVPTNNGRRVKIHKKFVLRCESISLDDTDCWFLAPGSSHGQVVKFVKASAGHFAVYGQPLAEQITYFQHPVDVPVGLNVFGAIDKTQLQKTKKYRLTDMICKLCPIYMQTYTAFVPLPESFAEC
ncbi:uncharacterized protein LOC131214440 [Anopheles bellator]|uniref:uncharacterized protein LOC131214440 n=1 Tax=Anopheles bellator TaxID=139047 RepID=UPI0026478F99|nr:uncharacterized protein LOC131214440 [Anopheles bellator]